jgi:Domain of unknown function (DUF4836)
MKFRLTPYLLLAGALVFMHSCSDKAKIPVPGDAAFIVHINGASLNSKLSWDEIKQSEMFRKAYESVKDEQIKSILDNPDASGISIKSDAYLFMKKQGKGGYFGFTCEIKDAKAFNSLVEKINDKEKPVKDGSLFVIKGSHIAVTWSGNRLVIIGDNPEMNMSSGFNVKEKVPFPEKYSFPEDSLLKFAKSIHNLDQNESIAKNEKFSGLMKEAGDVHFWVNSGKLYGGSLPAAMTMVTKANSLFEGNISTGALNFENGKISINTKTYYNKDLAPLFEKYQAKNLDENMLKMIPGDVDAVFAMNYPPEGLKEFLKTMGVDGFVNLFLAKTGFGMDDFIKANKGDLLLAVTDFKMAQKKVTVTMDDEDEDFPRNKMKPEAKILFATSVGDKASYEKLIGLFGNLGKEGEIIKKMIGKIPYKLQDNWFITGNDSVQINSFGTGSTNHPFISKISGHPVGGYIDLQKIIGGATGMTKDSMALAIADNLAKRWQDIVFYCDNYKNGVLTGHAEINLVDKSTNSLKQLWNFTGDISKMMMQYMMYKGNMKILDKLPMKIPRSPKTKIQ